MKNKIIALGLTGILLLTASTSLSAVGQKRGTVVLSGNGYIQSLIDDADPGDTIYIPSGIYYEHIVIIKPITLIGEDKETTIIDGSGGGIVVFTQKTDTETDIKITGFTIRNGSRGIQADFTGKLYIIGNNIIQNKYGIEFFDSRYCFVEKNNISNNKESGIFDWADSTRNTYKDNIIISNGNDGLFLADGSNSKVINNTVVSNGRHGIRVQWTEHNTVSNNTVKSNKQYGIHLLDTDYNVVIGNNILDNLKCGVYVDDYPYGCVSNKIYHNNFIGNKINANEDYLLLCINFWYSLDLLQGNYWDDYDGKDIFPPWGIGDTPYKIPGSAERLDRFPLMKPYPNSINQNSQTNQNSQQSSSSSQIQSQYSPQLQGLKQQAYLTMNK